MKKEIQEQMKENKGITLIALVVTIVVLLILAGITISTLFGDNGIISAARKAADDTKTAEEDTSTQLGELANEMKEAMSTRVEPKNIEDWEWIKDETTETITITKYTGNDTELIIPNYIGGVKVEKVSEYGRLWSDNICKGEDIPYGRAQNSISKIVISEGIKSIGDLCFTGTTELKNIIIPDTVISIGFNAFFMCEELTSITIPNSVEYLCGFKKCTGLTSVTIQSGVTSIAGEAFSECTNLTNVTIPDTVTWIGSEAFKGCTRLTNITIPNSVTSMGNSVFSGIPSITVNVPFTSGNNRPSGWNSNWNSTSSGTVTVQYQQ